MTVVHVGVEIARPAAEVVAFIRSYEQLPRWAAGLASGVGCEHGVWFTDSPMGRVTVAFAPANAWGVCDHDVTLPDGTVVTNPVRVLADGHRCQVVFTVRGEDPALVEADAATVAEDLERLRSLLA